jgi:fibronectin type 3 domain-containing protein
MLMTVQNETVTISWDAVSGAQLYKIYYCDRPDGTFTLLDTSTGNSYEIANSRLTRGFYYVTADTGRFIHKKIAGKD